MIHIIGDSHTTVFGGEGRIIPEFPPYIGASLPGFCAYHLGSHTAYHWREHNQVTALHLAFTIPQHDWLMTTAGEIDCRCHIPKQAFIRRLPIHYIAGEVVDRYVTCLREIKAIHPRLAVWAPTPSCIGNQEKDLNTDEENHYGPFALRLEAIQAFNLALSDQCKAHGIEFLSAYAYVVYDAITGARENRPGQFYRDGIHLGAAALPIVIDTCAALGGV